jgi:hypothetical protein
MRKVDDTTARAAEPVACPECGEADLVQKISAIPDWPTEYGPPVRPSWFDLWGVVLLVGGLVLAVPVFVLPLPSDRTLDLDACVFALWVSFLPVGWGLRRLRSKQQQGSEWEEGMRFWKRLYFCPGDEVAFVPGGASTCPLHEVRDLLSSPSRRRGYAPKPGRFADFSPMPEEFADYERMLKEAKEKSGTLICYDCGHYNPIGQTNCEECGATVPQTARARWAYGKDK